MKTLVFSAALLLGTVAVAQDMPAGSTPADTAAPVEMETTTESDTTMPAETAAPAPMQTAPMQTAPMPMQSGTPSTVAPGNSAPERDARGIAVMSDPAMAPSGANQPIAAVPGARIVPSDNQAAVFATQPSTKEYPVCSRTVTDGCVQGYERGRAR